MLNKRKVIILGLFLSSMGFIGNAFYIKAKAKIADIIIASTWESREPKSSPQKPWPWADTQVVASITIPRLKLKQYVMQDASGESLAFGPGAVMPVNSNTYQFIAGHRDTHFKYLDQLSSGDIIEIETHKGNTSRYEITHTHIIDTRLGDVTINESSQGISLMTCWPMNSIVPGGPLRYVVSGKLI